MHVIKAIIQYVKEFLAYLPDSWAFHCYEYVGAGEESPGRLALRLAWICEGWHIFWHGLPCCWLSHKIVDDGSYANPDSGADHLRCERCGRCWSHVYY